MKNNYKKNRKKKSLKASPVKIAYYVQRMLEKKMQTKEIILIIFSQFSNEEVKEFAKWFRECFYIEDIRRIANYIHAIPKKRITETRDTTIHEILIKREIIPNDYLREYMEKRDIKMNKE